MAFSDEDLEDKHMKIIKEGLLKKTTVIIRRKSVFSDSDTPMNEQNRFLSLRNILALLSFSLLHCAKSSFFST